MTADDLLTLAKAVKQLQELIRAVVPLRDPYFARLAEQQQVIEEFLQKYQ